MTRRSDLCGWRRWWFTATTLALFPGVAAAQGAAPVACACRADSGVVWAEVAMTTDNIEALRRALLVSGPGVEGQVLTISNQCADPTHCADRDWKPLGAGLLRLKVTGHMSSPGLFDDKRLRVEMLTSDATLTLMGQSQ